MTQPTNPMHALSVLCGSRLYGTHRLDSDYDVRTVFVTPVAELCGLTAPDETFNTITDGKDVQMWELGKFMRMACNGSFTALELLYAPEANVLQASRVGERLRANREMFLTEKVRASLLGFVVSNLSRKLTEENDNYKPYLHATRILVTLNLLYVTGELHFELTMGQLFRNDMEFAWGTEDREGLIKGLTAEAHRIAALPVRFPETVDTAAVNAFLLNLRGFL